MPEPLTQYVIDLWVAYSELSAIMNSWRNNFYNLGTQIAANNWTAARDACYDLGDEYSSGVRAKVCDSTGIKGKVTTPLVWIDQNWGVGGGSTMDDILNEMLSATFKQLTTWMGITEAYKVAVWDAPFNEEYYAALARGFKVWGA